MNYKLKSQLSNDTSIELNTTIIEHHKKFDIEIDFNFEIKIYFQINFEFFLI